MALFGGQQKSAPRVEPEVEPEEQVPELPETRNNTIIAKDLTVTGNLKGEGVVQIEGIVEGELHLQGYIIIAPTGVVKGPIEGDVVRIAGKVEGNIIAHDHLRLEKSGTIDGDVKTVSFVIEDGGRLNGRTTMIEAAGGKPPVRIAEEAFASPLSADAD